MPMCVPTHKYTYSHVCARKHMHDMPHRGTHTHILSPYTLTNTHTPLASAPQTLTLYTHTNTEILKCVSHILILMTPGPPGCHVLEGGCSYGHLIVFPLPISLLQYLVRIPWCCTNRAKVLHMCVTIPCPAFVPLEAVTVQGAEQGRHLPWVLGSAVLSS
jgi:hypothetical protein